MPRFLLFFCLFCPLRMLLLLLLLLVVAVLVAEHSSRILAMFTAVFIICIPDATSTEPVVAVIPLSFLASRHCRHLYLSFS